MRHHSPEARIARGAALRRKLEAAIGVGALALLGCGRAAEDSLEYFRDVSQDIIGGAEASVGAWPTVVALSYAGSPAPPWWCGGTLIGDQWVLTAAHCVDDDPTPAEYEVIIGRHDLTTGAGQIVSVEDITIHPSYSGVDNDVAVLELATPVGTQPSRLTSLARMAEILPGDDSTILGWGDTTGGGVLSDTLQVVTLDVIGVGAACDAATDYSGITSNEICIGNLAGGQDSCSGDSGGPAFVRRDNEWFVLGATSWGTGCALPDLPGVYTFIPNYFAWIHSVAVGIPTPSLLSSAQIMSALG